jgi:hypothetical protein
VSHQNEALELEGIGHRSDIARHCGKREVTALRRLGVAVPAQVECDGAAGPPQVYELVRPLSRAPGG